ncbi:hypothetical protein SSCG_00461 [Streptomyces clavuligerus]|nr:hypothetical protein SSCG_00461 [Streptomyces clavuligerus]
MAAGGQEQRRLGRAHRTACGRLQTLRHVLSAPARPLALGILLWSFRWRAGRVKGVRPVFRTAPPPVPGPFRR